LLDGKTLAWAGLFAAVATAIGCDALGPLRVPLLILVVLLQLRSDITALYPAPEGWREVARIFRETALPQDTLYINYAAAVLPLRHYGWPESGLTIKVFAKGNEEPWFRGHSWPIVAPQMVATEASQLNRVWLLAYGEPVPTDRIANEIGTKSIRALHRRTDKLNLSLFLSSAAGSVTPRTISP
jgi:hypothetical protein